jgi:hypothetical protein
MESISKEKQSVTTQHDREQYEEVANAVEISTNVADVRIAYVRADRRLWRGNVILILHSALKSYLLVS